MFPAGAGLAPRAAGRKLIATEGNDSRGQARIDVHVPHGGDSHKRLRGAEQRVATPSEVFRLVRPADPVDQFVPQLEGTFRAELPVRDQLGEPLTVDMFDVLPPGQLATNEPTAPTQSLSSSGVRCITERGDHPPHGPSEIDAGQECADGRVVLAESTDLRTTRFEIGNVRFEPTALSSAAVASDFKARFGEARAAPPLPQWDGRPLRVLAWNIWHGGRRKGRDEGVRRVVEIIKQSAADIVLMQETYGSGPRISGRLGFDYFLRSTNLSVMSRFPIVDVHRLASAFRFGGVTIELKPGVRVQAYSLWINHLPSVKAQLAAGASADDLVTADAKTRGSEIRAILSQLLPHLEKTPDMPVIVGGDFNSGSSLDWTPEAAHLPNHHGLTVPWPVSRTMADAGFIDAFRTANPDPVKHPGHTWSPEFRDTHQDRIDYVYLRGAPWRVLESQVLSEHPRGWPSDHAAVLAVLSLVTRR